MKFADYIHSLRRKLKRKGKTPKAISTSGTCLRDLPPELIHQILLLVSQQTTLNFGLTCRRNYEMCQPALHHNVVLTPRNISSFREYKVSRDDPSLVWVKKLTLGREWRGADDWDMLSDNSILTVFPNLQRFNMLCHMPLRGWAGFLQVIETLPATVSSFSGAIYITADSHIWPSDRTFPSYTKLKLRFRTEFLQLGFLHHYLTIPQALSASFPHLVNLTMDFQLYFDTYSLRKFWKESHFINLEMFEVCIPAILFLFRRQSASVDDCRAVDVFLTRHASTLRIVYLPERLLGELAPLIPQFRFVIRSSPSK